MRNEYRLNTKQKINQNINLGHYKSFKLIHLNRNKICYYK
jgi:hypothetical protein